MGNEPEGDEFEQEEKELAKNGLHFELSLREQIPKLPMAPYYRDPS